MSFSARLDTKELDRVAGKLNTSRDRVCMRFAFQVEGAYKQTAPVDTSAMVNSCDVEGKNEDNFGQAASAAQGAKPDAALERHPEPSGDVVANVGPAVEYAAYVEFGTSKMAAQPALGPAVESLRSRYNSGQDWKEIVT